jgi:competence protein CoiA
LIKKGERYLLVALYQNQFVDMLSGITKEQWKEKNKTGRLLCPVCKNHVTPKCGTKKIWHFAHSVNSDCQSSYEAETNYHLLGKKHLYKWLHNDKESPRLEHYIRDISQRPDLYLPHKNHAIEYQCASMSQELFINRIKGYQSLQIDSDWIFGMQRINKKQNNVYYINSADLTAAKKDEKGKLLLNYFCPLQQKFLLLRNIVPISKTKLLAQSAVCSIKNMGSLENLNSTNFDKKCSISQWINQKATWRKTIFKASTPAGMYVKKILYLNHKSLTLASPLAGMPTNHFYHFETSPYIWQSYLLFLIQRKTQPFSFQSLQKEFARLIQNQVFYIRDFPYLDEEFSMALKGYLDYLVGENMLIKLNEDFYKKGIEIHYPETMDEAFQLDKIFSERGGFFDFV